MRLCLVAVGSLLLAGCGPSGTSATDEEKEPQFLIGRSRVNAMDYQGAIEAFEQALETNPRSAAAHFELGILYAEREPDPATAIYHYEKFLKLRPGAENAEIIRQHIFRQKQELAKAVLPIPPSTEIQRQMEQLAEENRQLRDQLDRLRATPVQTVQSNRPAGTSLASAGRPNPAGNPGAVARPATNSAATPRTQPADRSASSLRTHRVQAGETPMAIARRYNVKLEALLSVNPGLDPKRMRVGQSLVIPSR
ncbi:MAG: tetratricopeptide repeat protein [Verrucomicrobiota bacterium]